MISTNPFYIDDIYNMASKKKPLIDDGTWLNQPNQTEKIVPTAEPDTRQATPQEGKKGCGC